MIEKGTLLCRLENCDLGLIRSIKHISGAIGVHQVEHHASWLLLTLVNSLEISSKQIIDLLAADTSTTDTLISRLAGLVPVKTLNYHVDITHLTLLY